MRWAVRILAGLALALVLLLGGALFYLDEIASRAIEEGGKRALGVRTAVSGILVRPITGSAHIFGLEIDNPEGFDAPRFLTLDDGFVELDASTLRSDPIEISQIRLQRIEIRLERRDGRLNTDAILEHMSGGESAAAEPEGESEASSGPRVVVRELLIEDVTAHVDLVASTGSADDLRVEIPKILLSDIGARDDEGASMSQLAERIVTALLSAVAKQGSVLPGAIARSLTEGLEGLDVKVVGDLPKQAVDRGAGLLDEAGKGIGDAASGVVSKLFGGDD